MAGKTKNKSTAKAKQPAQRKKSKPAKKASPRKRSRTGSSASSAKSKRATDRKNKKEKSAAALAVLSPERLKELHAIMVKCRALAESIQKDHAALVRDREPELAGLEAMLVGAGAHLQSQDSVVLERNRLIAGLVRGAPVHAIFAELKAFSGGNTGNGSERPLSQGKSPSTLKITVDAVLTRAEEMKSQRGMTVLFCMEHPVTLAGQDALAIAAERKLPLVCLVENRSELELESSSPQTNGNEQTFYPRIAVDGNDLVAIFRVAQEAARRAREGHGPALIDCWFSTAIPTAADPILFMEQYLQRRKLWSSAWARKISDDFNREMKEALVSAHERSAAESQFDHVYSLDRSRK